MTRAGSLRPNRPLHRWLLSLVTVILAVVATGVCAVPAVGQPDGNGYGSSTGPKFLKLSLDSVTPTVITTTSDPYFVVSGTVTNIGDRVVDDISIRVQRARPVTAAGELRTALQLDQINYDVTGAFQAVSDRLSPGDHQQFSFTVALRGGGDMPSDVTDLQITEPGVYPLLLNVNGEPAYGNQARLDDARFLLPVLGVPATADTSVDAPPPVPATPAAPPVATTMLWPLADRPRLMAGIPGSVDGQALLTDDELASSLSAGGRLDQLLSALESALRNDSRSGGGLASALCLAIDPDLLVTVSAMITGYRVLASPSDPDGPTRVGSGAQAAKTWLDRLRTIASGLCTVALPFAQVDETALAAVNDPALTHRALVAPADVVDSLLSVTSLRGVNLPDAGTIDAEAANLLAAHGVTTAVLADNAVVPTDGRSTATADDTIDAPAPAGNPDMVRLPDIPLNPVAGAPPPIDPGLRVATFDIWSATALAAIGSHPPTPSFTPQSVRYDVNADSRPARLQDALGAISWSALNPRPDRPGAALFMPPQQWGANREEATALLEQLQLLFRDNLAVPRPFTDLLAQPADPQPYELDYLSQAADESVPRHFVDPVRAQAHRITELMNALVEVPQQELSPRAFLTPLRDDLIRTLTLSDRRSGGQPDTVAQRRLDQTTGTLDELFGSVTVLPPGGVYTLASEQSPLLLVARNDLPVAIRIKFRIDAPAETKITDVGEEVLPAKGTRSFQIPTEVSDSRNLVIPIALTTSDGVPLGNAVTVSVRSNAYGQALAIITGCAGALLFLLAGRRLWHRFRGQADPADEGFDPETRRRVNRFRRARKREMQRQEDR
ncbi:hypothetical protein FOH10_31610 [Nocardia otitidiscaviarum]|uniref:Glycoprotein n=1 Tax=Nocardia otitidiscaviarum TaxID=1823 RepID=A0A516NUK4_9NOCA|nr:DUF6049 family protein [Nocardia otitidiscaviarum]MCP9622000.1 DUF6049 family protein [Nocardia otitidiscaviarum]QDP82597.1 hypothetical protein FOH10_31610 [Nocardia otitidiscaviarum]